MAGLGEAADSRDRPAEFAERGPIPLGLLATVTVGEGGWVELAEPIIVRAGEAFIAVPEREDRPL